MTITPEDRFRPTQYGSSECDKLVYAVSDQMGDYRPTKLVARKHRTGWYPAFEATPQEREIVARATLATTADALAHALTAALPISLRGGGRLDVRVRRPVRMEATATVTTEQTEAEAVARSALSARERGDAVRALRMDAEDARAAAACNRHSNHWGRQARVYELAADIAEGSR